jgi:phosphate transport system protein
MGAMNPDNERSRAVAEELETLREQLASLADIVESVFAESIIALVDGDLAAAREVRQEDYKAHKVWLQADRLCVDLLASGALGLDEVNMVCASVKTALDLKMMADEAMHISQLISMCSAEKLSRGAATDLIPSMAELTQGILADTSEALANRSAIETEQLHKAYGELESLNRQLFEHLAKEIASAKQGPQVALALTLVGRAFTDMGHYAVDVANHIPSVHRENGPQRLPSDEHAPD